MVGWRAGSSERSLFKSRRASISRSFVRSVACLATLATTAVAQAPAQQAVDVLITGAMVYDGRGGAGRVTDIGIRGDRIAFVGAAPAGVAAKLRVDAKGLIVSPGFIDPHTHTYEGLPKLSAERRQNASSLMQGITTVVLGADGRGPVEVARILDESERAGLGTNTYALTGFGTVRSRVMGASSAPASKAQIDSMRALITQAMKEGAYGVGSGLFYAPQSYANTEEVLAVVSAAKPFGGVYDTHQRDESSYTIGLLESVRETIRIGCESGLTSNVGHIKALGVDVWGKADSVLAIMAAARRRGCKVTADQYPWTASGTGLSAALLPRWVQAGGRDSMLARIADVNQRETMLVEMRDNLRRRGGDSTLLLTGGSSAAAKPYIGKTLKQVAAERGKTAVQTALEMIRDGLDMGVASFNMTEADIETLHARSVRDDQLGWFRWSSASLRHVSAQDPSLRARQAGDHHAAHGAGVSRQVAETYGLVDRGVLRAGAFADVIVFDPKTIRDKATYTEPTKLATGVRWVFVNGKTAVKDGAVTGVLAGKGLRREVKAAR